MILKYSKIFIVFLISFISMHAKAQEDGNIMNSAEKDSTTLIDSNKTKSKAYIEKRGMISRDAIKTVFIPKGQWMMGGQVAWNQWDNENLNYMIIKNINFDAYTFSVGPYLSYFFAKNMAVGARFSYDRLFLNLGGTDINLGEDLNIGLKDLYYIQHSYNNTLFVRSYLPLGNSKVFGLFGEFQLSYTFSEGKNSTGSGETLSAAYERTHNMGLGLGGGMCVFLTDFIAAEVMLNVGGYQVTWGRQNMNNIEEGKIQNSGANFKLNLFSIKFGLSYFL